MARAGLVLGGSEIEWETGITGCSEGVPWWVLFACVVGRQRSLVVCRSCSLAAPYRCGSGLPWPGTQLRVVCLYWRRRSFVGGTYILAGRGGDRGIVCVVSSAVSGTSGSVASDLVIALASFEREEAARIRAVGRAVGALVWEFRCRVAQLVAACRVFLACDNVVLRMYVPSRWVPLDGC